MLIDLVKKLFNFFSGGNVYLDETNNAILIISKVKRKKPVYYLINIFLIFLLILFLVSLIFSLTSNDIDFNFEFFSLGAIIFLFCIYFLIRIKEGDTIIAMEDGIKELNWLYSRFIRWGDIVKVYFYSEGELSKKFHLLNFFDITWASIKIKWSNKTIRISTKFSNNEKLQEYIRSKCSGKIEERKYEPLSTLVIIIAAIVIAIFLYLFHPFRGLIE